MIQCFKWAILNKEFNGKKIVHRLQIQDWAVGPQEPHRWLTWNMRTRCWVEVLEPGICSPPSPTPSRRPQLWNINLTFFLVFLYSSLFLILSVIICLEKLFYKIFFFVILIWFCYGFAMVSLWLILCFFCLSSKQLWFRYGFVMVLECFIFSYEICYGWSYLFCKKIFGHVLDISELKKT